MTKKKLLFVWCLYDFANSFVLITFLLYFSKWLVVGQGLSDWWYNATYILGSCGLLIAAPWLGSRADKLQSGRRYLVFSTLGCGAFYSAAAISGMAGANLFIPALCFGLGNFCYQLSFIFYNPLLDAVAQDEDLGKASGVGFLVNYAGQFCGILMALPLVSEKISFGVDPLLAPLLPAVAIFLALGSPLMLNSEIFESADAQSALAKQTAAERDAPNWRAVAVLPGAAMFLWSFFFCSNAITTLVNNFSIFTATVFGTSSEHVSFLTLSIIVTAGIGSWMWGWLSDRYGCFKIQSAVLWSWVVVMPAIAWAPNFIIYCLLTIIAGLCIGGTFSVSRRLVLILVPKHLLNYTFGIYAVSERAAAIVGPLLWSSVLAASGYRWAMFALVIFQLVSALLMARVKQTTA